MMNESTPFESDTEFSTKDEDRSILAQKDNEEWTGLFFHQAVILLITHTICVYALLLYTLNGKKLQQQHSL